MILPRCPWCRTVAEIRQEHAGWVAGCTNAQHGAGPAGCVIQPQTLPMTTRAGAIREWKRGFRRKR